MKLILSRNQRAGGMLGNKVKFVITARAELSGAEQEAIKKYRLGDTELYRSHEAARGGSGLLGVVSRATINAMIDVIRVNDLFNGKTVECNTIVEMLVLEEELRDAAKTFKLILDAAATFGGEEVIELEGIAA